MVLKKDPFIDREHLLTTVMASVLNGTSITDLFSNRFQQDPSEL